MLLKTLRSIPAKATRRRMLAACLFLSGGTLAASGGVAGDSALRPVDAAAMRTTVETLAKDLLVPGAVVIVRTPKGNFSTAYGVRSYRGTEPTAGDLHVRIGSVTKALVGTAILQQVQERRLSLSDRVSKYRRDVPNGANITIAQLLDMSSGLFNYTETLQLNKALDDEPTKAWTQQELLAIAFANKPYFKPGQGFHYSNTNTVLLGLIAEQIDGKPLASVLRDRIFAPLGLQRTLLPATSSSTLPSPNARGYMYGSNVETMGSPPAVSADMQAAARAGTLAPNDESDVNPSWAWAAGAGISTADEVVTLVRALVGGTLLGPELQARRLASVRPLDPTNPNSAGYGLALAKFGKLYGHTGELPGYNTFAGYDPVHDVTVVVTTNLGPAPDGRAPATTIAAALIGAIYAPAN